MTTQSAIVAASPAPPSGLSIQGSVVRHFTPNWFAATMGTGILGLALAQFPGAPLLYLAGEALWIIATSLYALFAVLYGARWILYPREAVLIFRHPVASMFLGCIPMGLATVGNGFLVFGPAHFGQDAVVIAEAIWHVDVALAVAVGLAVPFAMLTRQSHALKDMTALWLLPLVAAEVASVSGFLLLPALEDPSAALPVLVGSVVLWALSVPLAMGVLVIFLARLVLHGLPPAGLAASNWLPLGPIGTGALGLFLLAGNGPAVLAAAGLGDLGEAISGAALLGGLILWAFGLWWLGFAVLATLHYGRGGKIPFNMGWWGFTFPIGVYALATLKLAALLPLPAVWLLGAGLVVMLGLIWVLVVVKTLSGALDRSLFVAPCLALGKGA